MADMTDGFHEVKFGDGGRYKGNWQGGYPHGQGHSTSPDGSQYVGEFAQGVPHGQGKFVYDTKECYLGNVQQGQKHGWGVWTHPAGDRYEGYFVNDERHGQGTYFMASGRAWSGEWRGGAQFKQMRREDIIGPAQTARGSARAAADQTVARGAVPAREMAHGSESTYDSVGSVMAASAAGGGQPAVRVSQDAGYLDAEEALYLRNTRPAIPTQAGVYDTTEQKPSGSDVVEIYGTGRS